MSFLRYYWQVQEQYDDANDDKDGRSTVILIMKGTFYEIYEYDPEECSRDEYKYFADQPNKKYNRKLGHACEIAKILHMKLTRANNNEPYSINNPYMMGFQYLGYEKHRAKIQEHNFNIVRIDQSKDENGKAIKDSNDRVTRFIAEDITPGTQFSADDTSNINSSNILSLYIEYQQGALNVEEFVLTCGVSSLDVTTGQGIVAETYSKNNDRIYAVQELLRYILAQQPRELIINICDLPEELKDEYISFLRQRLELENFPYVLTQVNKIKKEYREVNYQTQLLSKIFTATGTYNEQIIEQLGLEHMHYARLSYIVLLQYCYAHNDKSIENIARPAVNYLDSQRHLVLTHNAIRQMDLCANLNINHRRVKRIDSLFAVLNMTSTRIGYRYLHHSLNNPSTNVTLLNQRYNIIQELLSPITPNRSQEVANIAGFSSLPKNLSLYHLLERLLKKVPDLQRYQRLLDVGIIKPRELAILYRGYANVIPIYTLISKSCTEQLKTLLFSAQIADFNRFFQLAESIFDMSSIDQVDIRAPMEKLECCQLMSKETPPFMKYKVFPFKISYQPSLQASCQQLEQIEQHLAKILQHLNLILKNNGGRGKGLCIDDPKKNGITGKKLAGTQITITPAKVKILERCNNLVDQQLCGQLWFASYNRSKLVQSNIIQQLIEQRDYLLEQIRQQLYICYHRAVNDMRQVTSFAATVIDFIAQVDFLKSAAATARKYHYHKPVIVPHEGNSFLAVQQIRHPIIERIITTPYVANDISLGGSQAPYGCLLYGANATGKSSLAKALGLTIIMAQIGYYTPGQLTYYPYDRIITRLSGHDNLFKGQSSFVIEVEESRTILRLADTRTLVLGDEMCRGTETLSGTAFSAAMLEELVERKTSFIFSTHMHHLADLPEIKSMADRMQICHLDIAYDENTGKIINTRKLQPGRGSTAYGIEIAKSLGLDRKFIDRAISIRNRLAGIDEIITSQKSRYNDKLYMDACHLCGAKENLETHHLQPQREANPDGLIGFMHKNIRSNLMVLCRKCHLQAEKMTFTLVSGQDGYNIQLQPNNVAASSSSK